MALEGRGRYYGRLRAAQEWVLARLYGGGWPADLSRALGLQSRVQVVRHRVSHAKWRAPRPLRIAFASDLHAGPTTHPSLLDEAARALEGAAADVVLLGGDFVYLSSDRIAEVADRLAGVPAPLGRFAVMGNHDLWGNDRAIRRALEAARIRVLVNEPVPLPPPFDAVTICGLDDPWTGERDAEAAFAGVPASAFRILLSHAPEALCFVGPQEEEGPRRDDPDEHERDDRERRAARLRRLPPAPFVDVVREGLEPSRLRRRAEPGVLDGALPDGVGRASHGVRRELEPRLLVASHDLGVALASHDPSTRRSAGGARVR